MSDDHRVSGDEPFLSSDAMASLTGSEPQLTGDQLALHYLALLEDSNWQIRSRATQAVQSLGETGAGILSKAAAHADWHVRSSAAKAAGGIPSAGSASLLFEMLADVHPHVRQDAIDALGSVFEAIPDAKIQHEITKRLMLLTTQDAHRGVQARALKQLRKLIAAVSPHLFTMLTDEALAHTALHMLWQLDSRLSMVPKSSEAARHCIVLMLQNHTFYEQSLYWIASKVYDLGSVLAELETTTEGDHQRAVRRWMCLRCPDPRSTSAAADLLEDTQASEVDRRAAVLLFSKLRWREGVPILERLLIQEREFMVWDGAAWALLNIDPQAAFSILSHMLTERPDMRFQVFGVMTQMKTSEAVRVLMAYADDPVSPIRAEIMNYLGRALYIGRAVLDESLIIEVIDVVAQALTDDTRVRARAISTLDLIRRTFGDSQQVQARVVRHFVDLTHGWVRQNFLEWQWTWVLGVMHDTADPAAVPFLTDALGDPIRVVAHGRTVGEIAAEALAQIVAGSDVG